MTELLTQFRTEVALDLIMLAQLHDRELSAATISALQRDGFPHCLGFRTDSVVAKEALTLLEAAMLEFTETPDNADELAADFAAVYLTHNYAASPCESVWLDEDGLVMQKPMFAVRECYARLGFAVQDWRKRPDDHLVYQLQFLAALFELENGDGLTEAASFLDEHTLRWLPAFAQRVAVRAATPFYAGLAMLTAAFLDEVRDVLVQILAEPRPTAEEIEQRIRTRQQEEVALPMPTTYVPGTAPSW